MSRNLADILKKSKAIMGHGSLAIKETSQEKPNPEFIVPNDLKESLNSDNTPLSEQAIRDSNLPDFIKESFINNPLPISNPFDVEANPEYAELLESAPTNPIAKPRQKTPQVINEQVGVGLSESTIRLIIQDEISKALQKVKRPVISENQIKSTMIKMIKEGKLTIKKK